VCSSDLIQDHISAVIIRNHFASSIVRKESEEIIVWFAGSVKLILKEITDAGMESINNQRISIHFSEVINIPKISHQFIVQKGFRNLMCYARKVLQIVAYIPFAPNFSNNVGQYPHVTAPEFR
jgi:hypothetical protein